LGGVGQEGKRLVGAGVQGPQDHLLAGEGVEDALVCGGLFFDGRFGVAFQEAEFRAEQAHALCPELGCGHGVLGATYVGEERDQVTVRRRARAAELGEEGCRGRPGLRGGAQRLVWIRGDGACGAVYIDLGAVRQFVNSHGGHHGGQAEGAGDDRGVGLWAAACRDQGEDLVRVQGCGVRRGQVLGHQDEGGFRRGNPGGGHAPEFSHDAGADVQDVRGALRHVATQVVQHFGHRGARLPDGSLGRRAAGDELRGTLDQHGVLGHQRSRFQNGFAVAGGVVGPCFQFIVDGGGCCLECRRRLLGGGACRQLLAGRRFADGLGHLADGSDDAAWADANSWEVLH
jgi:hypothetical protein